MGIFESLGLGLTDILFHLANLIILVVGLYFLLFRPVKKLVANHKQKLDDVFKENQKLSSEANQMKEEYDKMFSDLKVETARVTKDATVKAEEKSLAIIETAKKQANHIVENAKKEAVAEKVRSMSEYKDTLGQMAISIAEKVLEREISDKDNQKIIDECLSEWDKQ